MSNLKEARAGIESEISHLKTRISLLKASLENLNSALQQPNVALPVAASKPLSVAKLAPQVTKKTKASKPLPKTGESFWLPLFGDRPVPASEIFISALSELSIAPTSPNAKTLRQRLSVVLSTLEKKGLIKSAGSGRDKVYVKANR